MVSVPLKTSDQDSLEGDQNISETLRGRYDPKVASSSLIPLPSVILLCHLKRRAENSSCSVTRNLD